MKLDTEQPSAIIMCHHCESLLWRMTVLKHANENPMSHEMIPVNDSIPKFNEDDLHCPKCDKVFMKLEGKEAKVKAVAPGGMTFWI